MWWAVPRSRTLLLTNIRGFRYDLISRIVFWNYKSFKVTLVFVENPHTIRNILYTVFRRFWQSTLIPATTSTTTTFIIEFIWGQRTFSIKIRGSRQACVTWKIKFWICAKAAAFSIKSWQLFSRIWAINSDKGLFKVNMKFSFAFAGFSFSSQVWFTSYFNFNLFLSNCLWFSKRLSS